MQFVVQLNLIYIRQVCLASAKSHVSMILHAHDDEFCLLLITRIRGYVLWKVRVDFGWFIAIPTYGSHFKFISSFLKPCPRSPAPAFGVSFLPLAPATWDIETLGKFALMPSPETNSTREQYKSKYRYWYCNHNGKVFAVKCRRRSVGGSFRD
jgi:hypothetical protein